METLRSTAAVVPTRRAEEPRLTWIPRGVSIALPYPWWAGPEPSHEGRSETQDLTSL